MASDSAALEPLLVGYIRVLRNYTPAQDLIEAFPVLRQKSLSSPSTLTVLERRLLLDLPDEDVETSNIAAQTSLSREQLLDRAVSDPAKLTQEEVVLLKDRFWTPGTDEEGSTVVRCLCRVSMETIEELEAVREPAYLPNEQGAFRNGIVEFWGRVKAEKDEKLRVAARAVLPDAKEWIQFLYQQDKVHWGFVCLYDAAAQQLGVQRLEEFQIHIEGFFQHALMYNGSRGIIDQKWTLMNFNAPTTAFAPVGNSGTSSSDDQSGAIFRSAFQRILRDPQEYQAADDVTTMNTYTAHLKGGIPASGILTNTFLVIDPLCIDSVLAGGHWYDNMRVLAYEADFPAEGQTYAEGYQGFTWVRLDQLVYNFYELRLTKADNVKMDEIWKAAQQSRHEAFVSLDPEEALSWTTSGTMRGFTRDSVMGKRWFAVRDARNETER